MVVVAILGILGGLAAAFIREPVPVEKMANDLSMRIGDASREARSAGPIREDVAEAEADNQRTRLFIDTDANGQYFAVELRMEDGPTDTTSSFYELSRTYLANNVEIAGYDPLVARTTAGGAVTALPAGYELKCTASGRCGPVTYYLQSTSGDLIQYRVVVLPLSSQPLVMPGW